MSMLRMLVVALATVVCTACAHYYKVTEPSSGKVYYTEEGRNATEPQWSSRTLRPVARSRCRTPK